MKSKFLKNKMLMLIIIGVLVILFINNVIAIYYSTPDTSYYINEDELSFTYNFSENVVMQGEDQTPLSFIIKNFSSSLYPSQSSPSFYGWFNIHESTGNITISPINDNQTGRYNVSLEVSTYNDPPRITGPAFYFYINASNDAPNITSINNSYNLTANVSFVGYTNASDEEAHYPLIFNLSFYNNCTKYPWNNRSDCNILSFINSSNTSAMMNFTPNKYDAGSYWANVSVMDYGANYNCISGFCLSNYSNNATYYYNRVLQFNVYPYLEVNASNCSNFIFQENVSGVCFINITTREFSDNVNFTSTASLRNFSGYISNTSWFFERGNNISNNYTYQIVVNITPQKSSIGNWTINFSAIDTNFSESNYDLFNITVNRTTNDIPRIATMPNVNTSINLFFRVNVTVYDDDNLIPDRFSYNETIRFEINVTNQSDPSQSFNFTSQNFTVFIINHYINGTNRTQGVIELTPNSSMAGNYYVNITAIDKEGGNSTTVFNMSINNNIAPQWTQPFNRTYLGYEHNNIYYNLSYNATELDIGDTINFTYSTDSYFPSFNINLTTGIINFTPIDSDVGFHIVTININDGFLTNSTTINFTILNINESVVIRRPILVDSGGNGNSDLGINVYEDTPFTLLMYVEDTDLGIISNQKSYYNESITLTSLNIDGRNTSLFNFTQNNVINNTNYTLFLAPSINPSINDTGSYVISINVNDRSGNTDSIIFNLIVNGVAHRPNITDLTNQSTAVNRTFYYRINATDIEDGSSTTPGNNNFTFGYIFLNGSNFINANSTIFNTTTGEINYTFNLSQAGKYRLNITVNDSSGLNNSNSFWIFVYDTPNITTPDISTQYNNLVENQSFLFSFTMNHSVEDNLTCEIYIESSNGSNILKNNFSAYGNNSVSYWNYSINFSEETFGVKNLTLIAYPSSSTLLNANSLNVTKTWNITINHTNSLLEFENIIGGPTNQTIYGGSPQGFFLSDFFRDYDATDPYTNQSITFIYNTTPISGSIIVGVQNWTGGTIPIINFSSSTAASANYTITAIEWDNSSSIISNVTSNVFTVQITAPVAETTPVASTGGSGGSATVNTQIPYALKIITPSKITGYTGDKIIVPIKLMNNGKETFNNIHLSALAFKDGNIENLLKVTFDNNTIDILKPGQNISRIMIVYFKANKTGDYEVTVFANSTNPVYSDWSKIFINLEKTNESYIQKLVLFTEEFLVQNPSCLELTERLKEADRFIKDGDYSSARAVAEEVLNSCKKNIEQISLPSKRENGNTDVLRYFLISCVVSIIAGICYYYFKRRNYKQGKTNLTSLYNKGINDININGKTNF